MTLDKDMQGKDISRSRLSLVTADRKGGAETSAAPPAGDAVPSPFSAAVPDRYFETAALRDCHARIARAALDSDTVAVVEGERGCGKTTFVRMLQQRVGPSRELCYIEPRIPQGERYLLDRLRRAFGAEPAADTEALVAHLLERGRRGAGGLIVVDDADRLSVFALRWLFALKRAVAQAGGRLGVVVAMSPLKLDAALALPSFAPYRTHGLTRVELPHFSARRRRRAICAHASTAPACPRWSASMPPRCSASIRPRAACRITSNGSPANCSMAPGPGVTAASAGSRVSRASGIP